MTTRTNETWEADKAAREAIANAAGMIGEAQNAIERAGRAIRLAIQVNAEAGCTEFARSVANQMNAERDLMLAAALVVTDAVNLEIALAAYAGRVGRFSAAEGGAR